MDTLVRDFARLLSQSSKLESLHLSVPDMYSWVPFSVPRLNSLETDITVRYRENDPDFGQLLRGRLRVSKSLNVLSLVSPSLQVARDYLEWILAPS
jgi:hypothetical protein